MQGVARDAVLSVDDGRAASYRSRSWLDPRLDVRASGIEGSGLFAAAPFAAGELIAEIGGQLHRDDDLGGAGPTAHSSTAIAEGLSLVQEDDDPLQFGNHACDPNAWMGDATRVVARRAIVTAEEVTIDYALMSGYEAWSMTCRCGARNCRGVVTGSDWRRPDLQERYAGHWSPFLQARIDALR